MHNILYGCIRLTALPLILVALFLLPGSNTTAQTTPETWTDPSGNFSLEKKENVSRDEFYESGPSVFDPECEQQQLLTRDFYVVWPLWRQTINACWHMTPIGLVSSGSDPYLMKLDDHVAGQFSNLSNTYQIKPTKNDQMFLFIRRGSSANFTRFVYKASIESNYSLLGSVEHTFRTVDGFNLVFESGSPVIPEGRGLNYSQNGRWAVGATGTSALFRVDLENRRVMNFGKPIPSDGGWDPMMAVSIANDGRYAVATGTANAGGQWMRVYDLSTCTGNEYDYLRTTSAPCKYVDLTNFIKNNVENFGRFSMADFGDDYTLFFYNLHPNTSSGATKYVLRAPNAPPRSTNYIALGDSFASGEGAYNYFRGTDEGPNINNCHLSKDSYPYLIGRQLGIDNYHSVACSGARLINVIGSSENIDDSLQKKNRTNQYLPPNSVTNELDDWLPGYYYQKSFVEDYVPDTITISMIGNDIGFGDKIKRCILLPDECYNTYEDRLEILREVRSKFNDLVNLYKGIRNAGDKLANVYVIGYPRIGYPDGNCAINVWLSREELEFGNLLAQELNDVIRLAAKKAGVLYVDIENSLNEYRFCESSSELVAINGLTLGDDIPEFATILGNESYHPNAKGHRLMANTILEQTNSFTANMPAADSTATAPSQEDDLLFLNKPKTFRRMYYTRYNPDISEEILYKNSAINISVDNEYNKIYQPGSEVDIYLHSNPIKLTTVAASAAGTVNAQLTIPDNVSTGFHTLHIFGKDLQDNPIDTYKTVYIAHSPEDKNGNGLDDANEPCGVFEASGTDYDEDGIDDACDPLITLPSEKEPSPVVNTPEYGQSSQKNLASFLAPAVNPGIFSYVTSLAISPSTVPANSVLSVSSNNKTDDEVSTPTSGLSSAERQEDSGVNYTQILAVFAIALIIYALMRYAKR